MLHGYRLLVSLLKPEKNYSCITKDVEKKVDTSTFELDSPLPKGKKYQSNWIKKGWIKWENNYKVYHIKTKNLKNLKSKRHKEVRHQ